MIEVTLIRHGQSISNAGEATKHDEGVELTELGHMQSKCFAECLNISPSKIIYSPYIRAKQTAMPTIQKYSNVPVEEWPVQEFHYLDPEKLGITTQTARQKYVQVYWRKNDILYKDSVSCESFADFVNRITKVFSQLAEQKQNDKIIIFSHGYFMKLSVCLAYKNFPPPNKSLMKQFRTFALNYEINNIDTIQINYEQQKWTLKRHVHVINKKSIYDKIGRFIR